MGRKKFLRRHDWEVAKSVVIKKISKYASKKWDDFHHEFQLHPDDL